MKGNLPRNDTFAPTNQDQFSGIIMKQLLALFFCLILWAAVLNAQIPAGYYDNANGLSGAALKTALHNIIDDHTVKSYDYLWTAFQTTDDKSNGKVWDMYSDVPGGNPPYEFTFGSNQCGNYSNEGDCYNREHSFPKSWFGGEVSPMYTDLFHLVPTDGYVNSKRSNYPFGEVDVTDPELWTSLNGSKVGECDYPGYTGTVFEPIDEYKGDFARTYFYMATRYEDKITAWSSPMLDGTSYPAYEEWAVNMLSEWHENDPVSQKEIDRNNDIYTNYQHNRNPFIDHPEYVGYIWGGQSPMADEPSNHAADLSAHCITLNWIDATGDIVPEGYLLRMSAVGFGSIVTPVDGTAVDDDFSNKNIAVGVQKCIFGGLTPGTTYYFKIYGYTGSGALIDYKTDGEVMQVSIEAN